MAPQVRENHILALMARTEGCNALLRAASPSARTSFEVDALINIHSNFANARKMGAVLQSREKTLRQVIHLLISFNKHNKLNTVAMSRTEKVIIANTHKRSQIVSKLHDT